MTKLEQLQEELKNLRKKRSEIIFEKGQTAEDNKDLRENGAYIAMEEQEHYYTAKIYGVIGEIEKLTRKPQSKKITKKTYRSKKLNPTGGFRRVILYIYSL